MQLSPPSISREKLNKSFEKISPPHSNLKPSSSNFASVNFNYKEFKGTLTSLNLFAISPATT